MIETLLALIALIALADLLASRPSPTNSVDLSEPAGADQQEVDQAVRRVECDQT